MRFFDRSRRFAGIGGLACVVALSGVTVGAQEPDQERTLLIESAVVDQYPQVTAVVSAPAALGGGGYVAADFAVFEGGDPVEFSLEPTDSTELQVMLVIDTSGSMAGEPLRAAKVAVADFVGALPAPVQVGAVSFGPQPTLLTGPTTDHAAVTASVDGLAVGGETALYDAVTFAAEQFGDGPTDRALLVLSDGGDTASTAVLDDAVGAVDGIRVDVIELASDESNRQALEQLAAAGAGSISSTDDPEALAGLYRLVADALVNRYRITYTSTGHEETPLRIELMASDGTVLRGSTDLHLPAPPPTSTTAVEEAAPTFQATPGPDSTLGGVSIVALVVGAVGAFGAILALGLVAVSGDPDRRVARAGLGLHRARVDRDAATRVKDRVTGDVDRVLERHGRRSRLESTLDVAGISLRPGEMILIVGGATLVGALVALAMIGPMGVLLAIGLVPLIARVVIRRRAEHRRKEFADTLPGNLQLMANALRSGYGLPQALDAVAREASEPARGEFRRVILETRVGRDLGASLRSLADRMDSRDFDWVVGAIDINREVGGDLAAILETVGETVRDRQRVKRHIDTLTAEGRLSAIVLTALPPGLAGVMAILSPDYVDGLTSGAGLVAVAVGGGLLAVGWIWMSRMVRIDY